jgi:hypothetical protein
LYKYCHSLVEIKGLDLEVYCRESDEAMLIDFLVHAGLY